jgi:hypothetical protein
MQPTAGLIDASEILRPARANWSLDVAKLNLGDVPTGSTVAANEVGLRTLSGWTNTSGFLPSFRQTIEAMAKADEIGFEFRSHLFDQGMPGRYYASHAEPQLSLVSDHFAVSRPMCPSCRGFVSARAVAEGKYFIVKDPDRVWFFSPESTSWRAH